MTVEERLARRFHDLYECLAPTYGYETREDTKAFDPQSQNGQLMMEVCGLVVNEAVQAERERCLSHVNYAITKVKETVEPGAPKDGVFQLMNQVRLEVMGLLKAVKQAIQGGEK